MVRTFSKPGCGHLIASIIAISAFSLASCGHGDQTQEIPVGSHRWSRNNSRHSIGSFRGLDYARNQASVRTNWLTLASMNWVN